MVSRFSESITALRKERGLTQEQLGNLAGVSAQAVSKWEKGGAPDVELLPVLAEKLGVSIDALFGVEGNRQVNVEDVLESWLSGFPSENRLEQLCRLIWLSIRCLLPEGLRIPKMDYMESCRPDLPDGEGRLIYTQVCGKGGILLDVHAEDLSYVTLWPEPAGGYAAWLPPMEDCRRLFALLARPGCLELLEELHRRKLRYFAPEVLAKQTGLSVEHISPLLDALEEIGILNSMKLELEQGEVKAFQLKAPAAFVPFLLIAQCLTRSGLNYMYMYDYDRPLLRGPSWRKEREK